jgi:hypothetical protein
MVVQKEPVHTVLENMMCSGSSSIPESSLRRGTSDWCVNGMPASTSIRATFNGPCSLPQNNTRKRSGILGHSHFFSQGSLRELCRAYLNNGIASAFYDISLCFNLLTDMKFSILQETNSNYSYHKNTI